MGLGGGPLAGSGETLHYVNYEIHPDFLIEKEALPVISKYSKLVEGGPAALVNGSIQASPL